MSTSDNAEMIAAADAILGNSAINGLAKNKKADLDTAVSFEDMIAASEGLADLVFVGSPYTVLDGGGKSALIDKPFFVRGWRFQTDAKTSRDYVVMYVVTKDNEAFILTDGSTGIFTQMNAVTNARIEAKHPTPIDNLLVANGLRVSTYDLTEDEHGVPRPAAPGEKVTGEGRTFYLA